MTENESSPSAQPAEAVEKPSAPVPVALTVLRHIVALVYPLALLGSVVFLFGKFGPSGWLWLVVLVTIILGVLAPSLPKE
ncbi:hypothetical protein [Synoicihabitans lomoniglobus]|uniref:Uncharacterized protein n=1 Tax=Synoicihabitans lomoniglobus TaxID=2909285 RepID=A0AAF0I7M5_9BACT|nr:hypothetical protein [Opitutaceae bacterium LMO-M01]WED66856.1 hypothetical protein PXH66_08335 [Opitutaceae bacterium LMO-M01]